MGFNQCSFFLAQFIFTHFPLFAQSITCGLNPQSTLAHVHSTVVLCCCWMKIYGTIPVAVSYTHLDVYKRQV